MLIFLFFFLSMYVFVYYFRVIEKVFNVKPREAKSHFSAGVLRLFMFHIMFFIKFLNMCKNLKKKILSLNV